MAFRYASIVVSTDTETDTIIDYRLSRAEFPAGPVRRIIQPLETCLLSRVTQEPGHMNLTTQRLTASAFEGGARIIRMSVGLLLILLTACSEKAPPSSAQPAPEVEVITVTTQTVPDEPEFIGRTEAFRPVEIRPQVTGIIQKIFFTEGRNIRKGEQLYLIDPVPFKAAYLSASARVAQAQARLVQAEQDLVRVRPLLEEQAVSKKNVDDAVAETLAAKAALEAARSDLVKAKFDLDNTLITAPVSGRVGRSQFYEGRLVSAQTTLLTTIDQLDPMYVNVSVPESYLLRRRRDLAEHRIERPRYFSVTRRDDLFRRERISRRRPA